MNLTSVFESKKSRKHLLLCMLVAFAVPACVSAEEDPRTDSEGLERSLELDSSEAELDSSEAEAPIAGDTAETSAGETVGASPVPRWACPIPPSKELAFYRCVRVCREQGGTQSGCRLACCREFTGCDLCYVQ